MSRPTTLGALQEGGYRPRSVKAEIRANLLDRLRTGETAFPGILGFDDTVLPQLEAALLAGHDLVLLGERGQGKTRVMRTLVLLLDEWSPVVEGCEINDDPTRPVCVRCLRLADELGSELPVAWRHRDERYVEKLATPDTSVGDLVGDVDPVKVAEGRTLGDPETIHYGLLPRTNRGIFGINELPDLAERIQVAMFNVLEERDIQVRGYSLRLPLDLLVVATANPEDYTNRGRIITPLKDRFGAEIRTHYPTEVDEEVAVDRAGGAAGRHGAAAPARGRRAAHPWAAEQSDRRPAVGCQRAVRDRRRRGGVGFGASPRRPHRRGRPRGARLRRAHGDPDAARQGAVRDGRGGSRGRSCPAPAPGRDGRDVPWPARRASTCPDSPSSSPREPRSRPASWCRPTSCWSRSARCRDSPRCSTGSDTATTPAAARSRPRWSFVLEGLYLTRRIDKAAVDGRAVYGA